MKYEELLTEANDNGVSVDESFNFKGKTKGLYIDGNIALSSELKNTAEKSCILAEELGHHYTTSGNIIDMSVTQNRKQEIKARLWAYNKLVGLNGIINSYKAGCKSMYEAAEYLDVTEEFLLECIECYRSKYGVCTTFDNYVIYFEPNLGVLELI
jgi:hypothetical protein